MRADSIVSTGLFQLPLMLGWFCTEAALHAHLLPAPSKKEAFQTQGEPPCQVQQSLLETTWLTVTSQLRPARWECEKASKQTEVLPEAQQYIKSMQDLNMYTYIRVLQLWAKSDAKSLKIPVHEKE